MFHQIPPQSKPIRTTTQQAFWDVGCHITDGWVIKMEQSNHALQCVVYSNLQCDGQNGIVAFCWNNY